MALLIPSTRTPSFCPTHKQAGVWMSVDVRIAELQLAVITLTLEASTPTLWCCLTTKDIFWTTVYKQAAKLAGTSCGGTCARYCPKFYKQIEACFSAPSSSWRRLIAILGPLSPSLHNNVMLHNNCDFLTDQWSFSLALLVYGGEVVHITWVSCRLMNTQWTLTNRLSQKGVSSPAGSPTQIFATNLPVTFYDTCVQNTNSIPYAFLKARGSLCLTKVLQNRFK